MTLGSLAHLHYWLRDPQPRSVLEMLFFPEKKALFINGA